MDAAPYDFAIVGANPLSAYLAGLLARDHGKRVVRVAQVTSPQRLQRSLDVLFMPSARPQTWRMLLEAARESQGLAAALADPSTFIHVDMAVSPATEASRAAYDHVAHLASGHGMRVRRAGENWLFRGIPALRRRAVQLRLGPWLSALGVDTLPADAHPLRFGKGGVACFDGFEAEQIVLADDAGLIDLPAARRPDLLLPQAMTASLLSPVRLPGPQLRHWPDHGVTLVRRSRDTALALVAGDADVERRLAATLSGPFPVHRLASSRFRRLVTADGAPLVGLLRQPRLFVVAGLGHAASFFAPALARLLAGAATQPEADWFEALAPARRSARAKIADYAEAPVDGEQAA